MNYFIYNTKEEKQIAYTESLFDLVGITRSIAKENGHDEGLIGDTLESVRKYLYGYDDDFLVFETYFSKEDVQLVAFNLNFLLTDKDFSKVVYRYYENNDDVEWNVAIENAIYNVSEDGELSHPQKQITEGQARVKYAELGYNTSLVISRYDVKKVMENEGEENFEELTDEDFDDIILHTNFDEADNVVMDIIREKLDNYRK